MSSADVLFKSRDTVILREMCPETKKEIIFKITRRDYEEAARRGFPATFESEVYQGMHGLIKLQIVTNSLLQVARREAVPVVADHSKDKSISIDMTSKVLADLNLSEKEITAYFMISGRGPVDAGEIMLLIDEPRDVVLEISNNLVKMGLARKIVGAQDYWEALPPYAALVKQQEMFAEEVAQLKTTTLNALDNRFRQFEQSTGGIKKLRDFQDFIIKTSSDFTSKMDEFVRRKSQITQSSQKGIDELKGFQSFIKGLGSELGKQIDQQDAMLRSNTAYFEGLKNTNNANLDGIKKIINDIRGKRDSVEKELEDRFNKLAGTAQSQLTSQFQGLVSQFATLNQTLTKVNERVAQAVDAMRLGPNTIRIQAIVKKTLENSFADIQNSVVNIQQAFIQNFHDNFNQIIRVNLSNFSSTIQSLLIDVVEQVEKIQQTNDGIVNSVKGTIDAVSKNMKDSFSKTSQSFERTIQDSEGKMGAVATQLEGLMQSIIGEFERVFSDVLGDFSKTANESKVRADSLSGEIDVALNTIRDVFKSEVVKELEKILNGMGDRVDESQKALRDFWERAKSEVMYSLKEVWFVRSPEAVISAINESLPEAKMRVLIIAPTLDDIDIRPILDAKSSINIRIACAIDVSNEKHLAIMSVFDEHPNISYRHYQGAVTIWGVNRDSEKCVVCVVSKSKEVAGIGTVLQEDIKIFNPILEECWMNSKKDIFEGIKPRKIDTSKVDLTFKPTHKTYYSTPKARPKTEAPAVIRPRSEVSESRKAEPIARPSPPAKVTPTTTAATMEAVMSAGISGLFTSPPADLKVLVAEGVKELERLARIQTGSSLGDNVEAFRQAIFNKMGFNSTLFELARAVRDLKTVSGPLTTSQQQSYIERFRMWASKLVA
nr:hypothetical protein [Candidatus Sigynarchaeota archaeon]